MRARTLLEAGFFCAGLGALGCGASFDPPTIVKSVRVLGVQKDQPYARPGDTVNLSLLWYDGTDAGSADPPRSVQIQWLGGCLNPPADSYEGCFAQYAAALSGRGAAAGLVLSSGSGPTFSVTMPTEAPGGAPLLHPNADPTLPDYALSYVFFSVCAGQLQPIDDPKFPLRCVDENGAALGPNDFVLGYTSIYMFDLDHAGEPYRNADPVIGGFNFEQKDVTDAACFGADCLGTCELDPTTNLPTGACFNQTEPQDVDCKVWPSLCISSCSHDGDQQKCPEHEISLTIDPNTFELDQVANEAHGTGYGEQMWIDYYSTRGKFKSPTKLLNDATTGYNNEHFTEFYAPSAPGLVRLWAVVHDNRGGVSWAGTTLKVE